MNPLRLVVLSRPFTIPPAKMLELVQSSPVGIAVATPDMDARLLSANRTFCRRLGYDEQELIGRTFDSLTHPEDLAATRDAHRRIAEVSTVELEKRYLHRDGNWVWMLVSATPLRGVNGRLEATIGHFFDISARKATEAKLADSESHYRQILQTTSDGFWAYDTGRRIREANDRVANILGYRDQGELIGSSIDDHLFPEDRDASRARFRDRCDGAKQGTYEVRVRRRDGSEGWVEITPGYLANADGSGTGSGFAFLRDVTDQRAARQELDRALQLRALLAANLPNTVAAMFDQDLRYLLVEGSGAQEGPAAGLVGQTLDENGAWPPGSKLTWRRRFRAALAGESQSFDMLDGHRIFATTITPVRENDGEVYGGLLVARDVTDARRASAQLKALAELDTLTLLPNRVTLRAKLELALQDGRPGILCFLDLDNFKAINDSLGHDAGDELLKEVAERLVDLTGEGDVVSRLSGDEFCILVRDIDDPKAACGLARRALDALSAPVRLGEVEVFVGASIGVARLGIDGASVTDMLTAADMAMYAAKAEGRGTYRFFRPEMAESAQARLALSSDLRRAVERDELTLRYQPQLQLDGQTIGSVEALVRWQHPERGAVMPNDFIGIAEETGFIVTLGEWVLRTACRQLVRWQAAGVPIPRVAVNVSVKQLIYGDFPATVAAVLEDTGLAPEALELEITETALMDADRAIAVLGELRQIGVSVAIDDFGTGFSSLARLRGMPVDVLKIDRAFVSDADRDAPTAAIVRSIISLAHNLGMLALAEGVERTAQRDLLLAEGCDMAGGWLWAPALAPDDLLDWIAHSGVVPAPESPNGPVPSRGDDVRHRPRHPRDRRAPLRQR